jgi:pyruvate, orthophosphate dikinase
VEIRSKALEVNIADYHVDVEVEAKYAVLQQIMSKYYGLTEGLTVFLTELSHPYKNWQFIVKEARGYTLDYFHLLKTHPEGPQAADLLLNIYLDAITATSDAHVRSDAVDNLLLYIQKIIKESGDNLSRFMPVIDACFHQILQLDVSLFMLFVRSYYQINRILKSLSVSANNNFDYTAVNQLLIQYFTYTYTYWLKEENPHPWFEKEIAGSYHNEDFIGLFGNISHQQIKKESEGLNQLIQNEELAQYALLMKLLSLPGYNHIVDAYKQIPQQLLMLGGEKVKGRQWKMIFLFHIMSVNGLSLIHEDTLWDINRTISWLISNASPSEIYRLIEKTFSILKSRSRHFPATALSCVLNMGKGAYKTDDSDLISFFINSMIDLGFQAPMIQGVGNDWQIKANSAHILNIRTWLELIELNPQWSPKLLSYLTIHLSTCGVFIKDTDLFPRDITRLLNSRIEPVYNLAKQLARLFPVFFNDIGAEGKLRDISTEIDELSHRKDVLIHFLRKQSHVESSNQILGFMKATLQFWLTKEKEIIRPYVPPYIYQQISDSGLHIDGVQRVMSHLKDKGLSLPDDLISLKEERIDALLSEADDVTDKDVKRVKLAAAFYKLLFQKYKLDFSEMDHFIARLRPEAFPNLSELEECLAETDIKKQVAGLVGYLEMLHDLILSDEVFEIRENIYKKRHFTVDIPSMYGSYHEMKFDALGLSFRIEGLVNVLFESYISIIDLSLITKATFFQIYDLLHIFGRALKLDGINSIEFDRQLDFLSHSVELRGITFTQYLDIFKGFSQAVRNIINDYFNNIHEENLDRILKHIPKDHLLPKYLPLDDENVDRERLSHRISEIFFRDQIARSLGLQQMDHFLSRILNTLFHQSDELPKDKLIMLLNYDPKRAMTTIAGDNKLVSRIIYLGAKGFHMHQLKQFGLPVPPGFIVTTEVFRSREIVEGYPAAEKNFREQLRRHVAVLEYKSGKKLGEPSNPLLVSVRSGSTISQPGMMDTFLDVGINETITEGIAKKTGNEWFAWDNYRRFMQCYGMAFDLKRNDFDAIMASFKRKAGVAYKRGLPGEEMKKMALTYKQRVLDEGIVIIDDPFEQLNLIIKKVLDSWDTPKAKTYRKIMGISDDWGTAVTVQAMVFGNLSQLSGTGVVFTHNPRWSGETLKLWGDFTLGNQGEDVVSGLVKTLPISIMQQNTEMRETDITLETHFPDIYEALKKWATELIYNRGWSPQEIEFTFEGPSPEELYLLQSRDMSIRERKRVLTFVPEEVDADQLLGHGIAVSGGAMSGRVVFSLEDIDEWRKKEPNTSLILVRGDTVPDDIEEIFSADALLTARGGMTSHAAVVAHRIGKTCIVGCAYLLCNASEKTLFFNRTLVKAGDYISIDGRVGSVYIGHIKVKEA